MFNRQHTVVVAFAMSHKVYQLCVPVRKRTDRRQGLVVNTHVILSVIAAGMCYACHLFISAADREGLVGQLIRLRNSHESPC